MIIWNEFNEKTDLQKIIDLVGMQTERESNPILVIAKFTRYEDTFEPHMAHINLFTNIPKINVAGMSGNIKIIYWTEINLPK